MIERKHYSPEQKIIILRELLENNVQISLIAEKYQVYMSSIYYWKKKLFEGAKYISQSKPNNQKQSNTDQQK